jgi:peptidoglycan/LPS O-acetylase OafA/YrhL
MGLLRLFLALSVIAGHANTTVFGFRGIGPMYAVNFFFIISGFYMAMVLNEKYKDTSPLSFYKSRALRLFPTYYIGVFIALLVSFNEISDFFGSLTLASKLFYVFSNLFIFGQDLSYVFCFQNISLQCASPVGMTINPPAWSLAVELVFYLVAPFILKSETKTFFFIALGCVYLLVLNGISFPIAPTAYLVGPVDIYSFNYYFYPSSFVFFGGGALAYHLSRKKASPHYFAAVITLVALSFSQTVMPFWHLLFLSMAIPMLFGFTERIKLDRSIGELSYPAYILHFPVLLFLSPFTKTHPQYFDVISIGSWVAIFSCAIGLLIYLFVEKRINLYRESGAVMVAAVRANNIPSVVLSLFFIFPAAVISSIYLSEPVYLSEAVLTRHSRTAFNLTDENWIDGVHRRDAAFFVSNDPANLRSYQKGRKIKFSDGAIREIIRVDESVAYLNVYLDGPKLDGQLVGFPNEIEIIK